MEQAKPSSYLSEEYISMIAEFTMRTAIRLGNYMHKGYTFRDNQPQAVVDFHVEAVKRALDEGICSLPGLHDLFKRVGKDSGFTFNDLHKDNYQELPESAKCSFAVLQGILDVARKKIAEEMEKEDNA